MALSEGADKYYSVLEEGKTKTEESIKAEIDLAKSREETIKKSRQSLNIELLSAQGKTSEVLNNPQVISAYLGD